MSDARVRIVFAGDGQPAARSVGRALMRALRRPPAPTVPPERLRPSDADYRGLRLLLSAGDPQAVYRYQRLFLARYQTQLALVAAASFVATIQYESLTDAACAALGPRLSRYDLSDA